MLAALAIAASLSGQAIVVDGDTLVVDNARVRLWGIDAPEMGHPFAREAASRLRVLTASGVTCAPRGNDRYGRVVARCAGPTGQDLGAALVREGLARDWPRYSGGAYAHEEAAARDAAQGLWNPR